MLSTGSGIEVTLNLDSNLEIGSQDPLNSLTFTVLGSCRYCQSDWPSHFTLGPSGKLFALSSERGGCHQTTFTFIYLFLSYVCASPLTIFGCKLQSKSQIVLCQSIHRCGVVRCGSPSKSPHLTLHTSVLYTELYTVHCTRSLPTVVGGGQLTRRGY